MPLIWHGREDGKTGRQAAEAACYSQTDPLPKNAAMWRPNLTGPQGPMQVGEKAALDVSGGDRFDLVENRAIGRAYLSLLYRRHGNWSDVVTAYNWGMGNVDAWIRSGRQSEKLLPAVASYLHRVLNDSGICRSSPKPVQDCIEP